MPAAGGSLLAVQRERNREDVLQVRGDVLALLAVAPGQAADQAAVLVDQLDAGPVELGLRRVGERLRIGPGVVQQPPHPVVERPHLVGVHRVVERQHGRGVGDGLEALRWRCAHALGGRVRADLVGQERLEVAQLPQERVVLGVADLGLVERVVEPVVPVQLPDQRLHPAAGRVEVGRLQFRVSEGKFPLKPSR